ncbi:hypothetical protein D1BOALGB6SA_1788 [Olavius sp. associated proteobacterium Delta 1]|nr:hypothetical protein D1BOALGB6SA_1788 [Olavius sp. associated proteobacterium Delta 1]
MPELNEEQKMILATVRKIAREVVKQRAANCLDKFHQQTCL